MRFKLISSLIVISCLLVLPGCGITKRVGTNDYSYLAPYVVEKAQWGNSEWNQFIEKLSDRHLLELALDWQVATDQTPGVNTSWDKGTKAMYFSNVDLAMKALGGRSQLQEKMKSEVRKEAYWMQALHPDVKWFEIVQVVCDAVGLETNACAGRPTFSAERAIVEKLFEKYWDQMSIEQRKEAIERTKLAENENFKSRLFVGSVTSKEVLGAMRLISGQNEAALIQGLATLISSAKTVATSTSIFSLAVRIGIESVQKVAENAPNRIRLTQMVISLHMLKAKALADA